MANSNSDLEDLKSLQRETAASKDRRKASKDRRKKSRAATPQPSDEPTATARPPAASAAPKVTSTAAGQQPAEDPSPAAEPSEAEELLQEFTGQFGSIVAELEEAARERPAMALLTAFAVGIIAGQLFSRK